MIGLTYRTRQEEQDDKGQQDKLLVALDAAPFLLRRDECGWWVIAGRHGSLQTWGDGKTWVAYIVCRSARHWTITKSRLGFIKVTHDGDDEGCLRLFDLPTPEQAVVLREVLGIRKRVEYSPQMLERKRASMAKAASAWQPAEAATNVSEDVPALSAATTPSIVLAGRAAEDSRERTEAEVEQ